MGESYFIPILMQGGIASAIQNGADDDGIIFNGVLYGE
jgi:hypothetical protein